MRKLSFLTILILATSVFGQNLECSNAQTPVKINILPDSLKGTLEIADKTLDLQCTEEEEQIDCQAYFSTSVYYVWVNRERDNALVSQTIGGFAGPIYNFIAHASCRFI